MWYAKYEDNEGNLLSITTYENEKPEFNENDIGWSEISEEEYNLLYSEIYEKIKNIAEENSRKIEEELEAEITGDEEITDEQL